MVTNKLWIDYDIIVVIDNKKEINNKPYELVFLRQNRNPVLRYVPDISVNISDKIEFQPLAFDPDEDDINITIDKCKFRIQDAQQLRTECNHIGTYKGHHSFIPQPGDIGIYNYNITVEDVAGLKVWQNDVRAYIYCEYVPESASGDENAKKHGDGRWHVRRKAYLYNPHCCNPN